MKAIPPWITYTVLRLLLIAVPLVVLLLIQVPWYFAAIIAAVVGLCLSYLLLGKTRSAVSTDIYEARARGKRTVTADDEAEDAVDDSARSQSSEGESGAEERTVSQSDDPGQLKR